MSIDQRRIERGDVSRALDGKERHQVYAMKAAVFTALDLPRTFSFGDVDIEVLDRPTINHGVKIVVTLAATQDGKPLTLNNPYEFVNPPLMVSGIDPASGEVVVREDLAAAWQIMLGQAVAGSLARRRGR